MYKTLLLLTFIASISTQEPNINQNKTCPIPIYYNGRNYSIHIVKEGIPNVRRLAYDMANNTIWFIYDMISSPLRSAVGYLNFDSETPGVIEDIRDPTSIAIDQVHNKIYVSGSDGIFYINNRKIPELLPNTDLYIKYIYFRNDVLYYINRLSNTYSYKNGINTTLVELMSVQPEQIVIDRDNNIFFIKNKKLYRVKIGTRAVNTHEEYTVDCVTTDYRFRVYFCTTEGIYTSVYNRYMNELKVVVSELKNVKSMVLNGRVEPIFVRKEAIYKLSLMDCE